MKKQLVQCLVIIVAYLNDHYQKSAAGYATHKNTGENVTYTPTVTKFQQTNMLLL